MAALIYDLISIQANGLRVKTNLNYSKLDVIALLSIEQMFDENMATNEPKEQESQSPSSSGKASSSDNSN